MHLDLSFEGEDPETRARKMRALMEDLDRRLAAKAELIGVQVIATAKRLVRVDTGRLRASLDWEVDAGTVGQHAIAVVMGTNVEYGEYVEIDYPYLRPAIRMESNTITRLVEEAHREAVEAVA
jgi:hypothetical protein